MAHSTNGSNGNGNGKSNGDGELLHYVSELTELEQDARGINRARRKLLDDAAAHGLHQRALKEVVKLRLESREQAERRAEHREKLDEYLQALGVHADPPTQPERRQRAART